MRVDLDTREFTRALNQYQEATGKDSVEALNRAGRNVAYRASQNTPAASQAAIRSGLFKDPHLRFALTSLALKRRGAGILKTPEFKKAVDRFVASRLSSARYLKAAWAEAVGKMGGTFRGAKFKGASGSATKATVRSLIAEIVAATSQPDGKHAKGAEDIGIKALQAALDFVAKDMIDYAEKKMAQTAKRFSA